MSEPFSDSIYESQTRLAERELSSFIVAVTELYGPEQGRISAQDRLGESDLNAVLRLTRLVNRADAAIVTERQFEQLPAHYVPFNVPAIGNDLVVTYVLHQEGAQFETDGPGLGFVDIYSS